MQGSDSWLIPLSHPLCADDSRVGGKAAQLHWLIENGFPVPDARVLSVSAFHQHFPGLDPAHPPPAPELSAALRDSLENACATLLDETTSHLAVRSSALGEDGSAFSYAGQHATYYYVNASTLPKAVSDCWMSLFSPAANAYRRHLKVDSPDFGMAVIIQRMVQADRAGVCFTRDPSGARSDLALIEAAWGLGAALVDGRVSPDRYWTDSEGRLVRQRIGRKRLRVAANLPDPSAPRLEPVPLPLQTMPVLSAGEVDHIGATARRIARLKRTPQDIEWAFSNGEFFVLQTRPVTAIAPRPGTDIPGRWVLFKPLIENFSEPLTPMTVDLLRRVLPPIGGFIHGWYYLNLDRLQRVNPLRTSDAQLARLLLLRKPSNTPGDIQASPAGWRLAGLIRAVTLLLAGYLSAGAFWSRASRAPPERLSDFAEHCERVLADPECDALEALKRLLHNRHPLRPIGEYPIQINLASGRYMILLGVLKRLLRRLAPHYDQTDLALLCSGGRGMLSRSMVEEIQALARIASRDSQVRTLLLDEKGITIGSLSELDAASEFSLGLAGFLSRFGHRTMRELELATPRWREDTTAVLQMIRSALRNLPVEDGTGDTPDHHGQLLAARDRLHQALRGRSSRALVDWLIRRIQHYAMLRENSRHYHAMLFDTVRRKLLMLENQLLATGRLRCADDVFFLEYPQIRALAEGRSDWRDVEDAIRVRRRDHQRRSQQPPPETINVDLPDTSLPVPGGRRLLGDCASPGMVEGVARVIFDPAMDAGLEPGEILVAPYTDPAWTPLFPSAAAIVVEIGSYLSHAGTLAREFQVPCLVDVALCTQRIRSGQRVRVNASEGWLEILE